VHVDPYMHTCTAIQLFILVCLCLDFTLYSVNNNNNAKICNAHNVSTWLNLWCRQSVSGEDGRSEIQKLFTF